MCYFSKDVSKKSCLAFLNIKAIYTYLTSQQISENNNLLFWGAEMIILQLLTELKWILCTDTVAQSLQVSRLTFIYFKCFTTIRAKNIFS